ncbi:MAG: hypothetical protein AAGE01_19980 [Pseudomonadota bacterium]
MSDAKQVKVNGISFFDEGEKAWVAVALEMDLYGYGESPEAAFSDLFDAMCAQLETAAEFDNFEMLFKKAPDRYFKKYREAMAAQIRAKFRGKAIENHASEVKIHALPLERECASLDTDELHVT